MSFCNMYLCITNKNSCSESKQIKFINKPFSNEIMFSLSIERRNFDQNILVNI